MKTLNFLLSLLIISICSSLATQQTQAQSRNQTIDTVNFVKKIDKQAKREARERAKIKEFTRELIEQQKFQFEAHTQEYFDQRKRSSFKIQSYGGVVHVNNNSKPIKDFRLTNFKDMSDGQLFFDLELNFINYTERGSVCYKTTFEFILDIYTGKMAARTAFIGKTGEVMEYGTRYFGYINNLK